MPAEIGNDYATGNSGGGAPIGNDNARGNDGGAPVGNSNAAKYHGWSDSLKHYHRLEGDARDRADRMIEERREMYAEFYRLDLDAVDAHIVEHQAFESEAAVRDAFRKLAAMSDQRHRTNRPVFEDGLIVEEECEVETSDGELETYTTRKTNPALEADFRLSSKRRSLEQRLGLIENERYLFVWTAQRE